MSKRDEILDMAVHALTPLMRARAGANASELFDESVDIGVKLVAKVEATATRPGSPERDELMDMGVHALSALLNGRQPARADDVLDECIHVAIALIEKVDQTLGADTDERAREELLDMAVHVQTALLNSRPQMPATDLADQSVAIARDIVAKVDQEIA